MSIAGTQTASSRLPAPSRRSEYRYDTFRQAVPIHDPSGADAGAAPGGGTRPLFGVQAHPTQDLADPDRWCGADRTGAAGHPRDGTALLWPVAAPDPAADYQRARDRSQQPAGAARSEHRDRASARPADRRQDGVGDGDLNLGFEGAPHGLSEGHEAVGYLLIDIAKSRLA